VFKNRVLRRIFGRKRDEMVEGWRKLHNEELHNLYCSHIGFWWESRKEGDHLEDVDVDGRIILRRIFER
jgi:hypothetical protein